MFDLQVVDRKAHYTNGEVNVAIQIYIGANARTAAGYCNNGPNGPYRRSKWAAGVLVKAPLGPTSPLEVAKVVTKANFTSSDQSFWDPFGLHFGTFFVSFLQLLFFTDFYYLLGSGWGSIPTSKVSIS